MINSELASLISRSSFFNFDSSYIFSDGACLLFAEAGTTDTREISPIGTFFLAFADTDGSKLGGVITFFGVCSSSSNSLSLWPNTTAVFLASTTVTVVGFFA